MMVLSILDKTGDKGKLDRYYKKYGHDPLLWISDFVDIQLPGYHVRTLKAIRDGFNRVATYGPHGLGKSVLASLILLWFISACPECKIVTTASAWHQLEHYLWPEIHKWNGRVDWSKLKEDHGVNAPELLVLGASRVTGVAQNGAPIHNEASAAAPTDPQKIEGAHAERVLYIFDEAKAIPNRTWEAAEGAFSTIGNHLFVALSTPGEPSGTFYDICSRKPGYDDWFINHVTMRDVIRAGRMDVQWARKRREAWGKDSAAYQQRVCGNFVKDADDAIIPLSWVEAAVARWYAWRDNGAKVEGKKEIGADTSGQGRDVTVFAIKYGKVITELKRYGKSRPMEVAGQLRQEMGVDGIVKIDTCFGEGAGTADRLKEFEDTCDRVICLNAAEGTSRTDRTGLLEFANLRAAMWWNAREMLDPQNGENICLPDDPHMIGDLTAPWRKTRSDGKILVAPKDDIKKKIGRSTDSGDAVVQALWGGTQVEYVAWV